jgi:transposase-like protein
MMNTELHIPQTLHEAIKFFADPDNALNFMIGMRWPGGIECPRCNCSEVTFLATRRIWKCRGCKKQFSVKVGTIFEDSPLALEKWLMAMWMLVNCKNGISSHEVARDLGVTQKSAWYMLHRVRLAMKMGSIEKLVGPVEVDETFVGGKDKNKHKDKKPRLGRGGIGKQIVMGVLERGGEVRTKVIPDTTRETLQSAVRAHVEPGATVYTDSHQGYRGLAPDLEHAWIDHAVAYAEGAVHTNGMENFWSLFDRMHDGTYTHIDPRHLQPYFDEEAFRFNNRRTNDGARFAIVAMEVVGKRIKYQELIERGLKFMCPE